MQPTQANCEIYEQDYPEWLDITLNQLQNRDLENLDWEHLIEEITALGNEQRRKVESYLRKLIKHLLLYQYWETEKPYCAKGWIEEIDNFRSELDLLGEIKFFTGIDDPYEPPLKPEVECLTAQEDIEQSVAKVIEQFDVLCSNASVSSAFL